MKYMVEENLSNFKFWSGAKDRAELLTGSQLDEIGEALEREYADRENLPTDTEINDLFWFDFEYVCGLIGLMYKEDGNVYDSDSWKEHAEEVVKEYCKSTNSDCYETYWSQFENETEFDELDSDNQIKEEFDEWVSDNWLDHAHEVLDDHFSDLPEAARDDFACEHWQNCGSDDYNLDEFESWYEEVKNQYENED